MAVTDTPPYLLVANPDTNRVTVFDLETRKLVAATVAAGQVQKLAKHGVDTFHFYTMNRADLVFAISHLLGIRPNGAQKAA